LNKSIFKRLFSKCAYYVRDKSWKHSIIWKEESAKMRVHFSSNHSFCFNSLCGYVESFGLCPFLTTHSPSSEWKLHTKKRETLWVTHMDNFSHLLFAQNKCSWVFSSSVKLLTIYLFYFFSLSRERCCRHCCYNRVCEQQLEISSNLKCSNRCCMFL
jgi:hypothetical protein